MDDQKADQIISALAQIDKQLVMINATLKALVEAVKTSEKAPGQEPGTVRR